jgi:hypothetical protein
MMKCLSSNLFVGNELTFCCLLTQMYTCAFCLQVLIAKIAPDYQTKLHRKHIAISMSRDCIKVC